MTEHLRPKRDGRGTADGPTGMRLHSDKDSAVSVNLSSGSVLSEKRERADGSASVDYFFFTFLPSPPAAVGMHHRVRVAPLRVSVAMRSDIKKSVE